MRAGEILELNTFAAVARAGGFARAAAELGVTPSAVSQSIRRLEARVGTRLFSRTTRSVALTRDGEALLLEVRPTLDRLAVAERVLTDGRASRAGRARISVAAVAMEQLVAPVLPGFREEHPDFQLDILIEDRLTDLVAQRYDAVIRRGGLLEQDMVARCISQDDRLILVASEDWVARKRPRHPHDLASDRIMIRRPRSGALLPWSLTREQEAVTIKGASGMITDSALAARQYAAAGLGVALLAEQFVAGMMAEGTLQRVLPEWSVPVAGFYLMYASRGYLPHALNDLMQRMAIRGGMPLSVEWPRHD